MSQTSRMLVSVAVLLLATAVSIWSLQPRPAGSFSTEIAERHLRRIVTEQPRPYGSPENRRVREYIAGMLRASGFDVQLHEEEGRWGAITARPVNVVARRAGTKPRAKALLLAAHYDSARAGPGAGDDGAAVAAILTVAEHAARHPIDNDLIVLLTDAEEMGMIGAGTFVRTHPWAKDVGAVLNFEARGVSGPSIMFETGPASAHLVCHYARAAPQPVTSSLATEVYRLMPNNTDLTVFAAAGMPGLNFAFIGGYQHYHMSTDDLAHLDRASLWHHGAQMTALVERLGSADLSAPRDVDLVYFNVWPLGVIVYSRAVATALAGAVLAVAMWVNIVRARRRTIRISWVIAGVFLVVATPLLAGGAVYGAQWIAVGLPLVRYHDSTVFCASFLGLAFVVTPVMIGRRRVVELTTAAGLFLAVAAVASAIWFAGGSYLPTIGAIAIMLALTIRRWWVGMAAAVLMVAVGAPVVVLASQALTANAVFVIAALVASFSWAVVPLVLLPERENSPSTG